MNEQLLCKDCKHSFRRFADFPQWGSGYEWKCRKSFKEESITENVVVGNKVKPAYYESCSIARMEYLSKSKNEEGCGKEGRWWQPKDKKHLFLLIKKEAY
jgi:hypothetical protein